MKNRFVRVTVVTIIICFFYFMFFTEKAVDVPNTSVNKENNVDTFVEPDTLFNENGYVVIAKPNVVKIIKSKDSLEYKTYQRIAHYKDEIVLLEKNDAGFNEVYKKLNFDKIFTEYEVPIYTGKLAEPDFKSNPDAEIFISRITEGCKEGVNFAGHYTLIYWGCGTSCQYGVIVDRKTGKIYDGYQTSLGSSFKANSKLILKNSGLQDEGSDYFLINHNFASLGVEIWDRNKFVSVN